MKINNPKKMTHFQSRILFWLVVILVIIGGVMLVLSGPSKTEDLGPNKELGLAVPVNENDHFKGTADATLSVVEYSDFQCPYCKNYQPVIDSLVSEFGNHIKLVYRAFPLRSIHPNAQIAAQAAESASLQGKFWEMHDKLFENQEAWSKQSSSDAKTSFESYAKELGLDLEKYKDDFGSSAVKNAIDDSYQSGMDSGVQGTPTIFVDNVKVADSSLENLRSLIREKLAK